MLTSIAPENLNHLQNFVRVGNVTEVVDASRIRVSIPHKNNAIDIWTSFAMGNQPLPQSGDKVLVAGENDQSGYIIGLFPSTTPTTTSFHLRQEAGTQNTILTVAQGDLKLRSEQGGIHLDAAGEITMNSQQFDLSAAKGNIKILDTSYQGLRLGVTIEKTKLLLGKINSTVGRIIEKAANVYRQVDNLHQIKAGRMRTVVDGTYHIKGQRLIEKADKEVRIDGEKINLG
ncbi:DUF3540 domain-containing protein [Neptunicella marina]|uniref:DUF3540 domain-containing protein n=1 Tax=Neptunicella marina TaxID=2125989 RepID=A0A8J6M5Q6_9ALTE|nr:DUF3540 domain-containing protein [Neptunicella marina]MBC3766671.1 DUF3540 domain-containing protein [Neptunicella marina]